MMEITEAGLIVIGDEVIADGVKIGEVAGFDESHFPNHMNILIRVKELKTGLKRVYNLEVELYLGFRNRFQLTKNNSL